jgi:hypothetical protein
VNLFFSLLLLLGGFLSVTKAISGACPPEYGKILYECNPTHEKQLFIIGMGHRDALTGANGRLTAKIQAELYKLGEWLIRQEGVELVLPEGFFKTPGAQKTSNPAPPDSKKRKPSESLDLKTLEAKLADKTAFINAEILLKRDYPIVLRQVEDKKCYEEVGALIGKLSTGGISPDEYARTQAELDFLQDKRTAGMLQKIPEIIGKEFEEGRIKTRKAIFTIGLSHIPPILKYLRKGGIRLFSPISSFGPQNNSFEELSLQQQKFRVSILIPKSLAEDPSFLEFNRLGESRGEQFPPFKISSPDLTPPSP